MEFAIPKSREEVIRWIRFYQQFDPYIGNMDPELPTPETQREWTLTQALLYKCLEADHMREEEFKRKYKEL